MTTTTAMSAAMTTDQLTEAFVSVLNQAGGATRALLLRSQAIAKQREAVELLRQADQAEHVAELQKRLDAAEAWLTEAVQQVDNQAAGIDELIRVERTAHDRVRDAEENVRQASEDHQLLALEEAPAAKLTDALLRVEAARQVLESVQPAAQRATANREAAERAVAGARQVVAQARATIKGAADEVKRADATPDAAPRSAITLLLGWQQAITDGTPLTRDELEVVRGLVEALAQQVGADKAMVAKGREQAAAEYRDGKGNEMRAALNPASQTYVMPARR